MYLAKAIEGEGGGGGGVAGIPALETDGEPLEIGKGTVCTVC